MTMRILFFVLMMLVSAPASAVEPQMPKPLQQQRDAGAQVYYLGKFDALDGWVMMRAGQPEFYYSTQSGNALVLGLLFDGNGTLLTTNQMAALKDSQKETLNNMVSSNARAAETMAEMTQAQGAAQEAAQPIPTVEDAVRQANPEAPAEEPSPAEVMFAEIERAPGFVWGEVSKPAFYAFLDPNCSHCQRFVREITPFVAAGKVSVHVLPVGFNEASQKQAAYLMGAADGPDRLIRYANNEITAIPINDVNTKAVEKNLEIMHAWDILATPIIVYRAPDGGVRLVRGRPLDIQAVVNDLTGTK